MFNRKLKQHVSELTDRVNRLVIEANCKKGAHEWEAYDTNTRTPYMRCKHCWARPEEKK